MGFILTLESFSQGDIYVVPVKTYNANKCIMDAVYEKIKNGYVLCVEEEGDCEYIIVKPDMSY